jgi:outer membrane protein assembly factor BamA
MSILDIIDKDKLKEILNKNNFEIIQKIFNEKTNEQKLEEVKKKIDRKYSTHEYIITEISITRGGKMKHGMMMNTIIQMNM